MTHLAIAKIAKEIVQLYHHQMSLLVLSNIAGLKAADLIDYKRGKQRLQELQKELQSMVRANATSSGTAR